MNAVDPRKFRYSVEAIRQRQVWQRDILQARLAVVNREFRRAREQLEQLKVALAEHVAQASLRWRGKPDPRAHENVVVYLAQSQYLIQQAAQELDAIRSRQAKARLACEESQRKLELTESHRLSCLRLHTAREQQMLISEADDEWTTRQLWLSNEAGAV